MFESQTECGTDAEAKRHQLGHLCHECAKGTQVGASLFKYEAAGQESPQALLREVHLGRWWPCIQGAIWVGLDPQKQSALRGVLVTEVTRLQVS